MNVKGARDEMVASGKRVFLCSHLENEDVKLPGRTISAGKDSTIFLCDYCSGKLYEEIVGSVLAQLRK
jgi:hypothetical protein